MISQEEKLRRQEIVKYAETSVMLEGFPPPQEEEKRLVECYINGEISLEQLGTEIRKDLQTHPSPEI